MDEPERAYLHFSFAPGQCIKDSRDGGSRLLVDTPESDAEAVAFLRKHRDKVFRAVIEVDDGEQNKDGDKDEGKATSKGRRPWLDKAARASK